MNVRQRLGMVNSVKICAVLIVKNEAHCIIQCLTSLLPNLSAVAIVDTGSYDGTIEKVQEFLKTHGIHGSIVSRRWKHFAISRNDSLEHADAVIRGYYGIYPTGPLTKAEYDTMNKDIWKFYITDADNILMKDDEECYTAKMALEGKYTPVSFVDLIPPTQNSNCMIPMRSGKHTYYVHLGIITYSPTGEKSGKYYCPIHEYIGTDGWSPKTTTLKGIYVYSGRHGGRSQFRAKADRDAAALNEAIVECRVSPKDADRCTFYLGQSYRDMKVYDLAVDTYLDRANMESGYYEERYYSLMQAASCLPYTTMARQTHPDAIRRMQVEYWLRAHEIHPGRREAMYDIMRYFDEKKLHKAAWGIVRDYVGYNDPNVYQLFVDSTLYGWKFDEQLCYCAFYSGDKAMFKVYLERAIADPKIDPDNRARLMKHRTWC